MGSILDRPARQSTSSLSLRDWMALCAAYGDACAYCGSAAGTLVIEHNMPEYRGGEDAIENILPACKSCNNQKCDLTPLEWMLTQTGGWRRTRAGRVGVRLLEERHAPSRLALLSGNWRTPILVIVVKETAEQYRFFPLANHKIGAAPHRYFFADRESFTKKENIRFLGAV